MKPFVRVVGVAFALGCHKSTPPTDPGPGNPPQPEDPVVAPPSSALPTWDDVASGHPEGATNPPRPILVVAQDTRACFKDWIGGMVRPSPEEMAIDGHVAANEAAAVDATRIQCPEGQPDKLLADWAAWKAGPN